MALAELVKIMSVGSSLIMTQKPPLVRDPFIIRVLVLVRVLVGDFLVLVLTQILLKDTLMCSFHRV